MSVTATEPTVDHLAGFALLAKLGKRVLRPGGAELTEHLLAELTIGPDDDVVEIAPGRGHTARLILDRSPHSYIAIDRDEDAEASITPMLGGPRQQFRRALVSNTGLDDDACNVAVGEAVLTMHPAVAKAHIAAELARIMRPGGRLGLHEVAFIPPGAATSPTENTSNHHSTPDTRARTVDDDADLIRIRAELTSHFKVSFNAMTLDDWTELLDANGFDLVSVERAPLRLLEPDRIVADEGLMGAAKFATNVLIDPHVRRRVMHMRAAMRRNAPHLRAVALVARRRG